MARARARGRTPFLDEKVAEFAFRLPDRLKVRGRYGKWLLRRWLERHCPAADPWAKKKGFTVPVAAFIAPRAADLGAKIAANEGVAKVCDVDAVKHIFADEAHASARWPTRSGGTFIRRAQIRIGLAELIRV